MAVGLDADADYVSRTQNLGSVGQAVWSACGWVYFPSALTTGGIFTLVHSGNGRYITIANTVPSASVEMVMGDSQTGLTSWASQPPANTWLFLAIAAGASGATVNAWWSAEGSGTWNNVNRTNGVEGSVQGEIIYLGRTEVGSPDAPVAYFEQWRAFNSTLDLTAFQAQKPLNSPSVGSPILYWPLLTNSDTSDATGNSRTPTFNGTLTTQTGPTLGGGGSSIAHILAGYQQMLRANQ